MNTKVVVERNDHDFIQSASVTAMMRALLNDTSSEISNPDNLAKHFVSDEWLNYLTQRESAVAQLEKRIPGGIYYVLVRTKFFDDSLTRWLKRNPISQVVILGAGFDTRSIRLKKHAQKVSFYEIDLKAMLDYKKNIISTLSLSCDMTTYVPLNFQNSNVLEQLELNGFNRALPTYFLCEGLTFFLEQKTFENILDSILNLETKEIIFSFDYAFADYIEGNWKYYGAKETQSELQKMNEPHLFGINYDDLDKYLHNKGFKTLTNFTTKMLDVHYFSSKYENQSTLRSTSFFGLTEIMPCYFS